MAYAAGLKSEILRSAITLLTPGIVAAAPFLLLLIHYYPEVHCVAMSHTTLVTVLGFLVAMALRLLIQP